MPLSCYNKIYKYSSVRLFTLFPSAQAGPHLFPSIMDMFPAVLNITNELHPSLFKAVLYILQHNYILFRAVPYILAIVPGCFVDFCVSSNSKHPINCPTAATRKNILSTDPAPISSSTAVPIILYMVPQLFQHCTYKHAHCNTTVKKVLHIITHVQNIQKTVPSCS